MKLRTKTILQAVSTLICIAMQSGGYYLVLFILAMLQLNPWINLFVLLFTNIGLIFFIISPWYNRFCDYIEDKVFGVYNWFARRKERAKIVKLNPDAEIYFAEFA